MKESGSAVGFAALNLLGEGTAGLDPGEFEVGWWLLPEAWGHGFASEAAAAVCEEAFERVGATSVIARVQPENRSSVGVAGRLGMSHVLDTTGRFGEALAVYRLLGAHWPRRRASLERDRPGNLIPMGHAHQGPSERRMPGLEAVATAEEYRAFARFQAAGRSPGYEALAYAVAETLRSCRSSRLSPLQSASPTCSSLRRAGSSANLQTRVCYGNWSWRAGDLWRVMSSKRTQTNEPARCAVFLPALGSLPEPLALLEVGAAAGLTLLPDVYSYDYGGHGVRGTDPDAPTLRCRPAGRVPIPDRVPEVVWRAGIDLNPLDVRDDQDVSWLECLVWPGEADRAERLQAAVAAARRQPPLVHSGDLLDDLPAVAAQAPFGTTLVIYHSATLTYVDEDKRRAFVGAVHDLGAGTPDLPDQSRRFGVPGTSSS
jgi:Uncharacterized protein conserved in bacteria (DUF2332)/Acetyltransferase (GNAT) domain